MDQVKNEETTLFRFGVIFPLLGGTFAYGQKSRMIAELAAKEYEIPGSMRRILSRSTIHLWLAAYQERGLEGLSPQTRSDRGGFRKISTETELALRQYKDQHPDWKLTTLMKIGEHQTKYTLSTSPVIRI